jgi:cytochrome c oxidase subunit II
MRVRLIALAALLAFPLAACGGDDEAAGGDGAQSGEEIYSANCARCHGPDGEGGVGPQLGDGAVAENFPDIADQIDIIANGRNQMPAWSDTLSDTEIESVATYEREELGQ